MYYETGSAHKYRFSTYHTLNQPFDVHLASLIQAYVVLIHRC